VLLKNLHPKFCQIRKKKRSNFIYPFWFAHQELTFLRKKIYSISVCGVGNTASLLMPFFVGIAGTIRQTSGIFVKVFILFQ
jgi:hypothetical protein